jgi:hypothetical protein
MNPPGANFRAIGEPATGAGKPSGKGACTESYVPERVFSRVPALLIVFIIVFDVPWALSQTRWVSDGKGLEKEEKWYPPGGHFGPEGGWMDTGRTHLKTTRTKEAGGWIPGIIQYRRLSLPDPQVFAGLDLSTVRQRDIEAAVELRLGALPIRPLAKCVVHRAEKPEFV